ncbi:MAG TPA: hypothetical protein VET65_00950 [Candidatus Limnocylindrales bacterium]|nr:hypothetical protein [Candidatus Limnocylindrales bacterium]
MRRLAGRRWLGPILGALLLPLDPLLGLVLMSLGLHRARRKG